MTTMSATADKFTADRNAIARIIQFLDSEGLEGGAYLEYAHELMTRAGFIYTQDAPCSCQHNGETGHAFFCGYSR